MKPVLIAVGVAGIAIGAGAFLHHPNHWKTALVWVIVGAISVIVGANQKSTAPAQRVHSH